MEKIGVVHGHLLPPPICLIPTYPLLFFGCVLVVLDTFPGWSMMPCPRLGTGTFIKLRRCEGCCETFGSSRHPPDLICSFATQRFTCACLVARHIPKNVSKRASRSPLGSLMEKVYVFWMMSIPESSQIMSAKHVK